MDSISRQNQACHFCSERGPYLRPPVGLAVIYNQLILLSVCQRHFRQGHGARDAGKIAQIRRDDIVG